MNLVHEGKLYTIIKGPYVEGIYEIPYYEAQAVDEQGNLYLIKWEILDLEDEEQNWLDDVDACDWLNPEEIEATGGKLPLLLGIKEFADFIGWERVRLSKKFSRQKAGNKVFPVIPTPIQTLAATPVWTVEQAEEFKRQFIKKQEEDSHGQTL